MDTRHCDECKHFNDEETDPRVCLKYHKPRFYSQKNDNPYDQNYGYKRKCADYEIKVFSQREAAPEVKP